MMFSRAVDFLALEGAVHTWSRQRRTHGAGQPSAHEIVQEAQLIRTLRELKNSSILSKDLKVVPQARDSAGMICSSKSLKKSARTHSKDASLLTVVSRYQHRLTYLQLKYFLWWDLARDNSKEHDDFEIIEDEGGLPLCSCRPLPLLLLQNPGSNRPTRADLQGRAANNGQVAGHGEG